MKVHRTSVWKHERHRFEDMTEKKKRGGIVGIPQLLPFSPGLSNCKIDQCTRPRRNVLCFEELVII